MIKCFRFLALILFVSCQTVKVRIPEKVTIAHRTNPTNGNSKSIGTYSLGCLKGAKTFTGKENGLVISQSRRGRFWGHSQLIDLLTELGEFTFQRHKKFLILGDLSLSRGGPTFGGHSSHQNGLDVDIWFEVLSKRPVWDWLQTGEMKTVLSKNGFNKDFGKVQVSVLQYLSKDERVARVFVHPNIKKHLCLSQKNLFSENELRKIRPWYGHDDHLHLRLKCSPKDTQCENQKPPPEGSGCDQLDWWYSKEAQEEMSKRIYTYQNQKEDYIAKNKKLPFSCKNIYQDQLK